MKMLEKIFIGTILFAGLSLCSNASGSVSRQEAYRSEPVQNSPKPVKVEYAQQYALKDDEDLSDYIKPIRNDLD